MQESWNKGKTGKTGIYSDETLKKMSEAKKGKIPWNKGISPSEDTKNKISETLKGNIPWNKGLTANDDSRISKHWLGKNRSEETKQKISVTLKNK